MSEQWLASYYWNIRTLIAQYADILASEDTRWQISDEDEAVLSEHIAATLPFKNGSVLYADCNLQIETAVVEWRYVYVYNSAEGQRVFQYDNNEHHPEVSTHPHHMHKGPLPKHGKSEAFPIDLEIVTFEGVLQKIRHEFFS